MRSIKHRHIHRNLKNKKHVNTLKQWKMKGGVGPDDNEKEDVLAGLRSGITAPPAYTSTVVPNSTVEASAPPFPVATPSAPNSAPNSTAEAYAVDNDVIEVDGIPLPNEIIFRISKDKLQDIVDDNFKSIANYIMLYSSMINQLNEIYGIKIDNLITIIDEIKTSDFIPQKSYIPNTEDVEIANIAAYVLAAGFFSILGFAGGNKQKNKSLKFKNIRKNKTIKSRFNKKGGVKFDEADMDILKNIIFNIVKEIIKQTYIINALNKKLNNDSSLQEQKKFIELCEQLLNETKTTLHITNDVTMEQIKSEAEKSIFMDDTITDSIPVQADFVKTQDQMDKNADVALNNFQRRKGTEDSLMN